MPTSIPTILPQGAIQILKGKYIVGKIIKGKSLRKILKEMSKREFPQRKSLWEFPKGEILKTNTKALYMDNNL